jgi:hypothetical protein
MRGLSCGRRRLKVRFARVGGSDHDADGFLVETFEAAMSLQILQMAAQSPFAGESIELFLANQAGRQQPLSPLMPDRPALPLSKSLSQESEIRKRRHRLDATGFQLLPQQGELKPRFEMVHSCFEQAFAMQANPESNRAEARS